ncbi:MAG: hypothetical protein IKB82_05860 [Clostridia bacterium]|nr:hypothetical protein [Clostridia bacterium]
MVSAETNKDGSVRVSCRGAPEALLKEASAVMANICETVGAYLADGGEAWQAECDVLAELINLTTKRLSQPRDGKLS